MNYSPRRRTRNRPDRHVWVFSELNPDLNPKDIARILAGAAIEAAAAAKAAEADHEENDDA